MATIKDIAKLSGVSRGTVDRVLHGRGRVSAENEEKIKRAIEQLDYQPSEAGMALAAHKKGLAIGFLYFDIEIAPFHRQVLAAAQEKARELAPQGVEVRFLAVGDKDVQSAPHLQKRLRGFASRNPQICGWAVPGNLAHALREALSAAFPEEDAAAVPMVAYNMDSEDTDVLAYVGCDYRHAGQIGCGLTALMTWGKARVLLLSLDTGNMQSSSMRFHGFREEMRRSYPEMHVVKQIFSLQEASVFNPENPLAEELEMVREELTAEDPVNVVYIANPGNYEICPKLREIAGGRPLRIITNDLVDDHQRQMIEDGIIDATICQEPERQGKRPLEILYQWLAYHRAPEERWEKTQLSIETSQSIRR